PGRTRCGGGEGWDKLGQFDPRGQSIGALPEKSRGRPGPAGRDLSGTIDRDGGWPAGDSQGGRRLSPSRPCLPEKTSPLYVGGCLPCAGYRDGAISRSIGRISWPVTSSG